MNRNFIFLQCLPSKRVIRLTLLHFFNRFYKKTGEIVAIKMIDLEAELLHDE